MKKLLNNEFFVLKTMHIIQIISSVICGFSICMLLGDGFYFTTCALTLLSIFCVVSCGWGIRERIEYIRVFLCKSVDEDIAG